MKRLTITTKTSAQIAADFEVIFKTIKPVAAPQPVTQAERLAPNRKSILKQRRRGLGWKQIADGMALPPIAERVSVRVLKQVFGVEEDATNASPGKATPASVPTPVLASATGQSIALPKAPFWPMSPKEHEQFDRVLQGLIPPIVKGFRCAKTLGSEGTVGSEGTEGTGGPEGLGRVGCFGAGRWPCP